MKGETFTSEVTGATREACQAAALAQGREYFGSESDLEIVEFSARRISNPDQRAGSVDTEILAATAKIKEKAKPGRVWVL